MRNMSRVVLNPKESAKFIAENAKNVTLHDAGIKALAKEISDKLRDGSFSMKAFSQCDMHPQTADEDAINWLFVVDTLNFCFWSSKTEKWEVTWRGKTHTGYFALCAALNRAVEEGYLITNPKYYSQITMKDLTHILRGDNQDIVVPLLKERQDCLHQVGLVLLEQYDGKFSNCIKECDNSATKLLQLIIDKFDCFRDEADFQDKRVSLYKRAQILIGDIWACFQGNDLGLFKDIEELSMFADYRVPQVLIHFKAMEYTKDLMDLLKKDTILKSGCTEEVEIRGCSVEAVEQVVEEVRKLLPEVQPRPGPEGGVVCNSVLVDHYLWDYRRQHAAELEHIPFHKTLSVYY